MPIRYEEARAVVVRELTAWARLPRTERIPLLKAAGRVLAQEIRADRCYPTLDRTARDGFAVRSADLPGRLRLIGEVRAGQRFTGRVGPGEAVEIMTGAPVPAGADSIIMVEHIRRDGDFIMFEKRVGIGDFINYRGGEASVGALLLLPGTKLGYAEIAMLAAVGHPHVDVFVQPRVSILATGDELVEPGQDVSDHQIRNSNAYSLAAQVARAGGLAEVVGIARDDEAETRTLIEQMLQSDLLLLSGGVSAGKYDFVESALKSLRAEIFFDRVAIQPGQPLVFGRVQEKFFFGLPGNPASTMITFELFARSAVEALSGARPLEPVFPLARLCSDYRHRPGLKRFLPAHLSPSAELQPIGWTGSSDIASLTRANAFMVVDADQTAWNAGDLMPVLMK